MLLPRCRSMIGVDIARSIHRGSPSSATFDGGIVAMSCLIPALDPPSTAIGVPNRSSSSAIRRVVAYMTSGAVASAIALIRDRTSFRRTDDEFNRLTMLANLPPDLGHRVSICIRRIAVEPNWMSTARGEANVTACPAPASDLISLAVRGSTPDLDVPSTRIFMEQSVQDRTHRRSRDDRRPSQLRIPV